MKEMQFAVPTLFGLEGLAGDELRRMNMENVRVEDRRVLFTGDERALAKANICLRTGERIMVVLDVAINIDYGFSIPEVSAKVQDRIKSTIENMTGLNVAVVNVRIASVDMGDN